MSLSETKRMLAHIVAGRVPDELMLRAAKREIEQTERAGQVVMVSTPGALPDVTLEEAIKALAGIFFLMENTILKMQKDQRGKLVIDSQVADAFIDAKKVLTKYGYESVVQRKDPLVLTPIHARR